MQPFLHFSYGEYYPTKGEMMKKILVTLLAALTQLGHSACPTLRQPSPKKRQF
jgi:hypothetical protein